MWAEEECRIRNSSSPRKLACHNICLLSIPESFYNFQTSTAVNEKRASAGMHDSCPAAFFFSDPAAVTSRYNDSSHFVCLFPRVDGCSRARCGPRTVSFSDIQFSCVKIDTPVDCKYDLVWHPGSVSVTLSRIFGEDRLHSTPVSSEVSSSGYWNSTLVPAGSLFNYIQRLF